MIYEIQFCSSISNTPPYFIVESPCPYIFMEKAGENQCYSSPWFCNSRLRGKIYLAAQWYSSGLRDGWAGVRVPAGAGNFSLHHRVQTGSGVHKASYPMGTGGFFPGVKRRGREADHSIHLVPMSKNSWIYTSTPLIRLHSVVPS
jgi:hypothetical protein